jgi:hypothetical protein
MSKKIIEVRREDGLELYALEGYAAGCSAVKLEYGFSTGSENGLHGATGSFAEAQLGTLDENLEFIPDVYTEEDAPNKACIGRPKEIEGWNPDSDSEEVNWDELQAWVLDYCNRVLVGNVKKTVISNAHTGENIEVKDISELSVIKGTYRGNNMIELADGTWLKDMGDGRYYDEQNNPYATVETAIFDEEGNLDHSTEFHGYIKV